MITTNPLAKKRKVMIKNLIKNFFVRSTEENPIIIEDDALKKRGEALSRFSVLLGNKIQSYAILASHVRPENVELQSRARDINKKIIAVSEELLSLNLEHASITDIENGMNTLGNLIDEFKVVMTN